MKRCQHCNAPLDWPRARSFCRTACRLRAARRRAAGLPENALVGGGHGPLSLAESYRREVVAEVRAAVAKVAA